MISEKRLAARIDALSKITTKDEPGINRLAFTDADWAGRDYLISLMREANLTISIDAFGNVIGRREGRDKSLPAVMFGSHGDSVPQGGNYDGIVGILSAIEVIQSLDEDGIVTDAPLECALFMCEESSRFGAATLGSRAMCGELTTDDTRRLTDKAGTTLYDVLKARGLRPDDLMWCRYEDTHGGMLPRAFFEVHIEQGKVLESAGETIGVVTGIAAPTRMKLHIHGNADHSGATPMDLRHDGLCCAAEIILALEKEASTYTSAPGHPPVVGTIGVCNVKPNAMNVIPGEVTLGVDIRSIDMDAKARVTDELLSEVSYIARKRNIKIDIEKISNEQPVAIRKTMVDFLAGLCAGEGVSFRRMMSGAGHDAMHWAAIVPTGMLFIPCKDGVSHCVDEHAEISDIVTVAKLLYAAVTKTASADAPKF